MNIMGDLACLEADRQAVGDPGAPHFIGDQGDQPPFLRAAVKVHPDVPDPGFPRLKGGDDLLADQVTGGGVHPLKGVLIQPRAEFWPERAFSPAGGEDQMHRLGDFLRLGQRAEPAQAGFQMAGE